MQKRETKLHDCVLFSSVGIGRKAGRETGGKTRSLQRG